MLREDQDGQKFGPLAKVGGQWPVPLASGQKELASPKTEGEALAIGRRLLAEKERHAGGFEAWVAEKCEFSYRTARRLMAAARDAAALGVDAEPDDGVTAERDEAALARVASYLAERGAGWLRPERIGELAVDNPTVANADAAAAIRRHVGELERATENARAALAVIEALPPDGFLLRTPAGRAAFVAAQSCPYRRSRLQDAEQVLSGEVNRLAWRREAVAAYRAARIEFGKAAGFLDDEGAFDYGFCRGTEMPLPPYPQSRAELDAYVAELREVLPGIIHQDKYSGWSDYWNQLRHDAGLATSCDLPPAMKAELHRHIEHAIANPAHDPVKAFWPIIAPLPDDEEGEAD